MGYIGMCGSKGRFCRHFGHKLGLDFCILVLNIEEATSLSCAPASIRALPSSPPFNSLPATHAK